MTHVSPSCVKNGVLGVSIIQLRRGSDKKNLTEISTLTSEVVSSDKPYFFNRSLVHSSARDQLRNYDQFGLISRKTLLWVQNCLTSIKICWVFRKFLDSVYSIGACFWNIWYSFWGLISRRNTTRGSLHRRGSLHGIVRSTSTGVQRVPSSSSGAGSCAASALAGGSMSGACFLSLRSVLCALPYAPDQLAHFRTW